MLGRMGPLLSEKESWEYLAGRFVQDVKGNIRALKAQILTRLMPRTGLGFLIISTILPPLFSWKLRQPCTPLFPGLTVREKGLLTCGEGGCSKLNRGGTHRWDRHTLLSMEAAIRA